MTDDVRRTLETALWAVLFAGVIFFAEWIRITNPAVIVRSPDEKYYMHYARLVADEPFAEPRELVREYNMNRANWIYPIPLRIGYTYLLAAVKRLWRISPEQAGVAVSTAASILQLALVGLMGLRFFNRWTVLVALALLSVSPQDLAIARRVWGDGVTGCAAMIFLWLCIEASVRPRAKPWFAAIWIWGGYFMLLKESAGFFFGFCLLGLAIASWRRHGSPKRIVWIATGAVITALFSFALMALVCGGVPAVLETLRHDAQGRQTNDYLIFAQEGPWYSLPLGLWVLAPLATLGCVVGLIALILPRDSLGDALSLNEDQRHVAHGLGGLIVLVLAAATFPSGMKSLRFISLIVGPWYLMGALGLSYAATCLRKGLGPRR